MIEIISKMLDKLSGFDFWFVVTLVFIGFVGWYFLGRSNMEEQRIARRQIVFVLLVALIGVLGISIYHIVYAPDFKFPKNSTGILVLRLDGDDNDNSQQLALISRLNNELSKEVTDPNIEIRGNDKKISEALGWQKAHELAREIGRKNNAALVIWGNCTNKKRFYPRITIVRDEPRSVMRGDLASIIVQDINEVILPDEFINQSIYIAHFTIGYIYFIKDNYPRSLAHFDAALKRAEGNDIESNDIQAYTAISHWHMAQKQKKMEWHLQRAIHYFEAVTAAYAKEELNYKWAVIQVYLGNTRSSLLNTSLFENLQRAIHCYEGALQFFTRDSFPSHWAMAKSNIGTAYLNLPRGDYSKNLQMAIDSYNAALEVYNRGNFPMNWALTQNNLGTAYAKQFIGNGLQNLQTAILCFKNALMVYTQSENPVEWAITQNNLGEVYRNIETEDRRDNLQSAINCFQNALNSISETDFPIYWATIQNNLGNAYCDLEGGNQSENIKKAIAAYEEALRITLKLDAKVDWALTLNNLGTAFRILPTGNLGENLQKAIHCYEAALQVFTRHQFPFNWAITQNNLGSAYGKYAELTKTDQVKNLNKAILHFQNALEVWNEDNFPKYYQNAIKNLAIAQRKFESYAKK